MLNTDPRDESVRMLEQRIRVLLDKAGIPVAVRGYEYLFTAIGIVCEMPRTQNIKLVSFLYAKVASQYETNIAGVERGMRFAINAAWEVNAEGIKSFMRVYRKPTVGQFIIKMAYITLNSI